MWVGQHRFYTMAILRYNFTGQGRGMAPCAPHPLRPRHPSDAILNRDSLLRARDFIIFFSKLYFYFSAGERVDINAVPDEGSFTVTTDKGTRIDADMVFKTIGLNVQSDAYRNSFGKMFIG